LKSGTAVPIIVGVKGTLSDSAVGTGFRVSTDIVVFAIREDALQVLLRRYEARPPDIAAWALPGGYVADCEPLDDCAQRTLAAQTGLEDIYLEQLYTFGQPERHPGSRVISVAYYALVSGDILEVTDSGSCGSWWDTRDLPELYLDHGRIVRTARQRLAAKVEYSTIAFQLMPEFFTLSELQSVYETVLGRPVDKRNFRKRVLSLAHVEPTDRMRRNGSHRPARLYRYTARDAIHFLK
jgi:8-oxo-dGTP diphosphatase